MHTTQPSTMSDDEENDDFFPDEEDDDDEIDFVPGQEDEDEEEEDEEEHLLLLEGHLDVTDDKKLVFEGATFRIQAESEAPWDLLAASEPSQESCTLVLRGPCESSSQPLMAKAAPRKLEVTWSVYKEAGKKGDDDDDDAPSFQYRIHGREIEVVGGNAMEFRGGYAPVGGRVACTCQVRLTKAQPAVAAAAVAAAVIPAGDDDDEEADDGVDYDELIALHEDAGLPVEALRKRYRENGGEEEAEPKKGKATEVEDDDDDDYGF